MQPGTPWVAEPAFGMTTLTDLAMALPDNLLWLTTAQKRNIMHLYYNTCIKPQSQVISN